MVTFLGFFFLMMLEAYPAFRHQTGLRAGKYCQKRELQTWFALL